MAPNGDTIPLFSAVGGASGLDFVNTVFDDSAPTSITAGTAPFTGTFVPEYSASSTTLTDLQGLIADGTWQLEITNTTTGARLHAGLVVAEHHAPGHGQSGGFDRNDGQRCR